MQSVNRLVNWLGFDSKFPVVGRGTDELKNNSNLIVNNSYAIWPIGVGAGYL